MFKEIDDRFDVVKQEFINNNNSIDLICKAYEMAKTLHNDQRRKDGQLYLSHPVEVAIMLTSLGFDESVVSAGLLHDVVEDCGCDLETIKKEFNIKVAEMVDCVSAIDQTKFIFDKDNVYEDENFQKASIEEQSFKKLIAIGKNNPLGFCIKFADRLHNLRTINSFDYNKQLEKLKETEKWIIPIAKILGAEYFYRSLKNECFKIQHQNDGENYFNHYNDYHKSNIKNINDLQSNLEKVFNNTLINKIKIKDVKEYKVFEDLQVLLKKLNVAKVSQGQIMKVTNYNIYLLYDDERSKEDVISEVLSVINKRLRGIKIIDAKIGNFTKKPYYQIEDKYKNKFNIYIESNSEYILQRNGTLDGQFSNMIDEENIGNLDVELIRVKTRSNENKYIAKNSTVLDFAFKIHRDLGFGFKYAIINNSKTKNPPYTKLIEGDKVEIVVDKDEEGNIINNAKLKWFAYVNSEQAKKYLIKHFETKIN